MGNSNVLLLHHKKKLSFLKNLEILACTEVALVEVERKAKEKEVFKK